MAVIALLALVLDVLIGWPDAVYRRVGHPVTWAGRLIAALDRTLNKGRARRAKGALTVVVVLLAAMMPAVLIQAWLGPWVAAVLAWPLVAARSLDQHLRAVALPLAAGDLAAARGATAMIVGRDVTRADTPALSRASLESLAENFSDGVIAPLFWAAVGGLPGIAAYKAINTMDSMIGHRSDRYEAFGKVAARVDDVVNLIPARLTGLAFACASSRPLVALKSMLRDAPNHRSPNAGWPEGAMAAALHVRLSGPRVYDGHTANEPWLNEGAPDPDAQAMRKAVSLYHRALVLCGLALAGLAML